MDSRRGMGPPVKHPPGQVPGRQELGTSPPARADPPLSVPAAWVPAVALTPIRAHIPHTVEGVSFL